MSCMSIIPSRLDYINCKDVVELITSNSNKKRFIIIDVRGNDVGDLVIHTAINIPSPNFKETATSLASIYKDYDLIIIHCMMSQTRGPTCAMILNECFKKEKYKESHVQIRILRGGFERFYSEYGERRELFDVVH
ncbi:hypothetical protein EHI8A_196470 [Entamoeba histolytica HM-1:IMSS-B]|uniref:Rhodanese domain-containing protein n=3 Tax=Entamoeba histolytica TaxID=5759 RepID=C4M607_ENTH1|nr:hypothetical protein EHI_072020 [Entamoeba histolytica HM-1:IMSS]EAL48077.1 hypothetical protein EHI_072020 [Entamoeba histolytica HM-1:IMSS]EMH76259.1 hypothetical protein EHI8A_196470 [Entamoeba histolytica HM-1:IMSS-B]GAT96881.1 hypothetical protein CL6EHI_072020 [Entamoeba histolytica]|eukprot:XP_653464.1 hypothetical protein EHI_072020 [Entamoeba histolytica HM-1:IMSS]